MSYSDDIMRSLTYAIQNLDGLKYQIKELNKNMSTIERLAIAIEEQNRLKQEELKQQEEMKLVFKPKK